MAKLTSCQRRARRRALALGAASAASGEAATNASDTPAEMDAPAEVAVPAVSTPKRVPRKVPPGQRRDVRRSQPRRFNACGFAPRKKFSNQTIHRMFVNNFLEVQPTTTRERSKLILLDVRLNAAALRESRHEMWLGPRAGFSNGRRMLRYYELDPLGFLHVSDVWLAKRVRRLAPAATPSSPHGAACRTRPSLIVTPATVAKRRRRWRQTSIRDALIVMRRNAELGQPARTAQALLFG